MLSATSPYSSCYGDVVNKTHEHRESGTDIEIGNCEVKMFKQITSKILYQFKHNIKQIDVQKQAK